MRGGFSRLSKEERLRFENDVLKMKLMLENGAQFTGNKTDELPAETENEFLKNMIEFERQFDKHKTVIVFDKLGKPKQFRLVTEIPETEINRCWEELYEFLLQHGISLDVCSPNVSKRELYRFTTEELFKYEIGDISIPGMVQGFIYDEFYPDPVYNNAKAAKDDCIEYILDKRPMEWLPFFRKEGLRLNEHSNLSEDRFKEIVNRFKLAYDTININELHDESCSVNNGIANVKGTYKAVGSTPKENHDLSGNWEVVFEQDDDLGNFWYVREVKIGGINF